MNRRETDAVERDNASREELARRCRLERSRPADFGA